MGTGIRLGDRGSDACPVGSHLGDLAWDEDQTPHAKAALTCRTPDSVAVIDPLDARVNRRLVIAGGYEVSGVHREPHAGRPPASLSDLHRIRDRAVLARCAHRRRPVWLAVQAGVPARAASRILAPTATEWAYRQVFTSDDDPRRSPCLWLERYNTHRPHTALG